MRGDVYRLKKPRSAQGHEQRGERYAVVVQANAYDHLSAWLVAPTTTKSFGSMIHPTIAPMAAFRSPRLPRSGPFSPKPTALRREIGRAHV